MADQGASADQKRQIASYFILQAPTGEVKDVVADVKTLVGDSTVLDDKTLAGMLRDYNLRSFTGAKAADGTKTLVTPYGRVDDALYVQPSTGKVVEVDHVAQTVVRETDQRVQLPPSVERYREAVEAAVRKYVKEAYVADKCVDAVYGTDDGKIHVCLSAANTKLRAFWSGGLRSHYAFSVSGKGATELEGDVRINVHYFEDGNVQLNTDHKRTERTVEVTDDAAATAASVVAAIRTIEGEFQVNLEAMYIELHDDTFKALRRNMPLNKQRFNWDSNMQALASQLGSEK